MSIVLACFISIMLIFSTLLLTLIEEIHERLKSAFLEGSRGGVPHVVGHGVLRQTMKETIDELVPLVSFTKKLVVYMVFTSIALVFYLIFVDR